MNSIVKEIHGSLHYFTNASDSWEELKIRYLRNDVPQVFTLESSISQGSKSITEYFNDFKSLWDEYINYRPLPIHHCGILDNCTCAILKNLADRQQADYVMKFLIGLHKSYSAMRSKLLLLSPLLSVSKVFSMLLQEESQRSLTDSVGLSLNSLAMPVAQPSRNPNSNGFKFTKTKGKSDVICSHCAYLDILLTSASNS